MDSTKHFQMPKTIQSKK